MVLYAGGGLARVLRRNENKTGQVVSVISSDEIVTLKSLYCFNISVRLKIPGSLKDVNT